MLSVKRQGLDRKQGKVLFCWNYELSCGVFSLTSYSFLYLTLQWFMSSSPKLFKKKHILRVSYTMSENLYVMPLTVIF